MRGAGIRAARAARAAGSRDPVSDPFAVLGLDRRADLTDDEVRAAWRRIAAVTHPDRADGGDPERFAAAAAAYTDLRTTFGRGEARAGVARVGGRRASVRAGGTDSAGRNPGAAISAAIAGVATAVALGRPARLVLRVIAAMTAATIAILIAGPDPAGPALATGALTWLILTARRDVGPRSKVGLRRQQGSGPTATGRDGSDDQADQDPT